MRETDKLGYCEGCWTKLKSAFDEIEKEIEKRLKEHKSEKDPDGFYICQVQDQLSGGIAPKGEWLGTEKERQEAIKEKERMDKLIGCNFCNLCQDVLKLIKKARK